MSSKRQLYDCEYALQQAGNGHTYQIKAIIIAFLQYMASAFIGAGWPLLFEPPILTCYSSNDDQIGYQCTNEEACQEGIRYSYDKSDTHTSLTEQYDLICGEQYAWRNYSFIIFSLGGIAGSLYFGQMMESKGRIWANNYSMGTLIMASLLGYFCPIVQLFAVSSFFINFGFRGFSNSSVIYLSEVTSDNLRKLVPSILKIGWSIGQILIAYLFSHYFDWRNLQLFAMSAPLFILFLIQTTQQESPKYLVMKKQYEAAKESLVAISKKNQRDLGNFDLKEQQMQTQIKSNIERMFINSDSLKYEEKEFSYQSLFTYQSIRIRTFIIMYIWGTISISYFMTAYEARSVGKGTRFHVMTMGLIELVSYLISANLSLTEPRLKVIKYSLLLIGTSHIAFFLLPNMELLKTPVFVWLCMVRIVVSMLNCFLTVYLSEVFPLQVRHFAFGLMTAWTKILWLFVPSYNRLCKYYEINPLFILGILIILGIPMLTKLRETYDQDLKDKLEEEMDELRHINI